MFCLVGPALASETKTELEKIYTDEEFTSHIETQRHIDNYLKTLNLNPNLERQENEEILALVIVNSNGCQARRLATDTKHTSQGWPPSISALYYIDGEISGLQLVRQGNIQCRRPKRSTVWVQGD